MNPVNPSEAVTHFRKAFNVYTDFFHEVIAFGRQFVQALREVTSRNQKIKLKINTCRKNIVQPQTKDDSVLDIDIEEEEFYAFFQIFHAKFITKNSLTLSYEEEIEMKINIPITESLKNFIKKVQSIINQIDIINANAEASFKKYFTLQGDLHGASRSLNKELRRSPSTQEFKVGYNEEIDKFRFMNESYKQVYNTMVREQQQYYYEVEKQLTDLEEAFTLFFYQINVIFQSLAQSSGRIAEIANTYIKTISDAYRPAVLNDKIYKLYEKTTIESLPTEIGFDIPELSFDISNYADEEKFLEEEFFAKCNIDNPPVGYIELATNRPVYVLKKGDPYLARNHLGNVGYVVPDDLYQK